MKNRLHLYPVPVLFAGLLFLAACNGVSGKPVEVDAPKLASSLKWVGTCAVLCSTVGGICLVLASRNRNRRD
ncbi:hypothetical protein Ga0100231_008080 [Opitutaceae bacterium TAV4]|nr:hypothetical protein Ga0100231_008080 [Opitutaceae bacterium TAV4]RRJ98413.1 hypothetical protein Ga0100230_008380 [Opitutaceae bacterium TAV3]